MEQLLELIAEDKPKFRNDPKWFTTFHVTFLKQVNMRLCHMLSQHVTEFDPIVLECSVSKS